MIGPIMDWIGDGFFYDLDWMKDGRVFRILNDAK